MDSIEIKRNGLTVSRVHFGDMVAGVAGHLVGKCFMVYDAAVGKYADTVASAVERRGGAALEANGQGVAGIAGTGVIVGRYALEDVSEAGKTLETVQDICRWLLDAGADRDAMLVSVGGGIVSDIVGFAAAAYKRGIRCAYVPTTLLAQVDAAIGGKTGVNLDSYKNIIGVFRQPEFTYICPEVLESLPDRVFRAGLAEMLKTFIIDNCGGRVEKMMAVVEKINAAGGFATADPGTRAEFGELVAGAAAVKAGVVSRDEFEGGERRKLNLGHTFAHAIEHNANAVASIKGGASPEAAAGHEADGFGRESGVDISHGEAVAMGMVMAASVSVNVGLAGPPVLADIVKALKICGLPTDCPFPPADLLAAMAKDKKAQDGIIHVILIRSIGDVVVRDMTVGEIGRTLE